MAGATVTLAIEGELTLAEFAGAVGNLSRLMESLTKDHADGGRGGVQWVIERLDGGSALVTARAEGGDAEIAERAADGFVDIARAGSPVGGGGNGYSPAALRAFGRLRSLVSDRVPAVRFENTRADVTVHHEPGTREPGVREARTIAYGAVEGLVQTLSNRGGLRFALYDSVFDKAVSCYLDPGREDVMINAWGQRAIVEGLVSRSVDDGRPLTIRSVSRVSLVKELPGGAYQRARGVLPLQPGDDMPEDAIRNIRDAV